MRKNYRPVATNTGNLITMVQEPNETVKSFADRLRRYVKQTNNSNSDKTIEQCLEHFRVKVSQPLRDILITRGNRKWNKCRDYAIEWDETNRNKKTN